MTPGRTDGPASPAGPVIEARGLTRRFGRLTAVDGIDLSVPAGCFFGFLGPNGSGKTTTVRMLTGLLPPSAGEARLLGEDPGRAGPELKRRIGVLPDDLGIFDYLTFEEHLLESGPIYGLSAEESRRRCHDLLALLDLAPHARTPARHGSTGMKKKLALALALLHAPRVLFLDEPFEGVDPVSGAVIRRLLRREVERGVTVFLTSHILEIVERLADRAAIIMNGRLVGRLDRAEWSEPGQSLEQIFLERTGHGLPDAGGDLSWLR